MNPKVIYTLSEDSPDNSLDIGLMQINTQHELEIEIELEKHGIKRHHLINDPCMNIYTGAYYLAIAFRKWGVNWNAVGAYNAGFAKNEEQTKRRKIYARKIHANYMAIKTQKKRPNKSRFYYQDLYFLKFSALIQSALFNLISPSIPLTGRVLVLPPFAVLPGKRPLIIFSCTH